MLLYVHRNRTFIKDGSREPRTATSTFTQLLSSVFCFVLFCKELIVAEDSSHVTVLRMTTFKCGRSVLAGGSVLCDSPAPRRVKRVNKRTKSLSGSESESSQFAP